MIDVSEIIMGNSINITYTYEQNESNVYINDNNDNEKITLNEWMMLIGGTSAISSIFFYNMIGNYDELFVDLILYPITYRFQILFHNLFGTLLYLTSKLILTTYSMHYISGIDDYNVSLIVMLYYIYSYMSMLIALIYIILTDYNIFIKKNIFKNRRVDYNVL